MVTYRLLGPLEVMRAGQRVDLGGPKQRTVLAALLLQPGRIVSTDRLVQTVWGDEPTPSAVGSLQAYLSNLRRALRDQDATASPIVRRTTGYLLDVDPEDIDTELFTRLADRAQRAVDEQDWAGAVDAAHRALSLWRGPLLVEHADEEWVRLAAVAYDERHVACQLCLVTGLLGAGQVNAALTRARALHVEQPLSEHACWLLMTALHRAGRSGEALEVFRAHARALDEDLGLDVGPALRDLQAAVLRQDPKLDAWPGTRSEAAPVPGVVEPSAPAVEPAPALPPSRPELDGIVGRDAELAVIRQTLLDDRPGLRWVVLSGEAGIGKSRLAEEALTRWQDRGGRVLRTNCPDDDVPPWWPVRQLLRDLGADADAVLLPPAEVDVDAARFLVYERVLEVVRAAGERRLLVLVDDVHWADRTSLSLLTHLAETQPHLDLGVIVTVRDGVESDGLSRLLAGVARLPTSRTVRLPPLTHAEVAVLAGRVSGADLSSLDAEQLADRTGGNPFFVCEYARLPEADRRDGQVPVAVRSVLGRRLATLDPEVLSLLRIAALAGGRLEIDLLCAVSGTSRIDLVDLLDDAADEHIVVPAPGSGEYAFAHALLRDAVVAGLTPMRQQRLHLRIAEALDPAGGTDNLVRRASHLIAAMPLADAGDAFQACRAAALDAERTSQWDAAAEWWQASLHPHDTLPAPRKGAREELLIARAAALARAGRGAAVVDFVDEGLLDEIRAGRLSSAGRLAVVPIRSCGAWPWVVKGEPPAPLAEHLRDIEPLVRDNAGAHARVLTTLAVGLTYDPAGRAPDELSRQAMRIAEADGDADIIADTLLGRALTFAGIAVRADESRALLARLEQLPHRLSDLDAVLRHSLLVMVHMSFGQLDAADEHVRRGAAGADALRLPVARTQLRWAEGMIALWRGQLDTAASRYAHAAQLHAQTELYTTGSLEIARVCLHWARGDLATVEDLTPESLPMPWASALVAVARDTADCDDRLTELAGTDEPPDWMTHGSLTALAHAVADRNRVDLAGQALAKLLPYRGRVANVGHVTVVGPVDLALARLYLLLGDRDAAAELCTDALELATRTGAEASRIGAAVLQQRIASTGAGEADVRLLGHLAADADRLGFHHVAHGARALANGAHRTD